MGTAIGGVSTGSPGGAGDQQAQAAASVIPAVQTSATEPQASNTGNGTGASDMVSRAELEKSVTAERSLRKRLGELEAAETERQNAALSDNQRLAKTVETLQAQVAQFKTLYAEALTQYEAKELGFTNAQLGAQLVVNGLEFGEDGKPTNAKELLKALLKTDSYLAAPASADGGRQPPPTVANLGATNGGGGKAGQPTLDDFRKGKLTMQDSARMWADGSMQAMLEAEATKHRR